MATTQYIGARYVPLFADPVEWNNTRTYEPLTIVVHEGNSYTSRQYVPKGIDISNDDFWALTGNYNAQVEQYRKDVTTYNDRITANEKAITAETTAREKAITAETTAREKAITAETTAREKAITAETTAREKADTSLQAEIDDFKRRAIYIGNSFTKGVGSTSGEDGLYNLTKHLFEESWQYVGSGYGFGTYTAHNSTFNDLLKNAYSDLKTRAADITDIVFISAAGDSRRIYEGGSYSQLTGFVQTTVENAKKYFPNSTVHVFQADFLTEYLGGGSSWKYTFSDMYNVYKGLNAARGINFIGWGGFNLLHQIGKNYLTSDTIHPTDDGYAVLKNMLINGLNGIPVNYLVYTGEANCLVNDVLTQYKYKVSIDGCELSFMNTAYATEVSSDNPLIVSGLISPKVTTRFIFGLLLNTRCALLYETSEGAFVARVGITVQSDWTVKIAPAKAFTAKNLFVPNLKFV